MKWFSKVKSGLSKTTMGITKSIFGAKFDANTIEQLEEQLIKADMGLGVAEEIVQQVKKRRFSENIDVGLIKHVAAEVVLPILQSQNAEFHCQHSPHVILFCGVNGNGKTTTAGKLASKLHVEGKKVLLAACDTFRAAAVEQLRVWSERSGADLFHGAHGADPASVAFQAVQKAQLEGYDVLIIDTAGRLQNKQNLMDELGKITRVMKKLLPEAPHDSILVVDATTGQNALSQVELFTQSTPLTGLIVTKLDSTAKGGIIVNLVKKFSLPVFFVGVGEGIDDLALFDPEEFVSALFDLEA